MKSYHKLLLERIGALFYNKLISKLIFLRDEDGDLIDNVIFFELDNSQVVGFYLNGANPLISTKRIAESDDFNLYSLYSELNEFEVNIESAFTLKNLKVVFHPDYDELIAIYLSSADYLSSFLIVFLADEIHLHHNPNVNNITEIIKGELMQYKDIDFLIFSNNEEEWE